MSEAELSWATPADASAMAAVHATAFDPAWSARDIEQLFEGPGVFGFLAGGQPPAGMMLCRVVEDDCEVLTIAVDPARRRQGLARAMVGAAMAAAASAGASAAFLEVAVDNPAASAVYASIGFRRIARRSGYYRRAGGADVDALVMRLDLNGAPA